MNLSELVARVTMIKETEFRNALLDCLSGKSNMHSLLRSRITGKCHCHIKEYDNSLKETNKIFPCGEEYQQLVSDIARWQIQNLEQ